MFLSALKISERLNFCGTCDIILCNNHYSFKLKCSGAIPMGDYAKTVLTALKLAEPVDESLVPEDSLIREFITGGIYEEFY